jgi:hypothetical protein
MWVHWVNEFNEEMCSNARRTGAIVYIFIKNYYIAIFIG